MIMCPQEHLLNVSVRREEVKVFLAKMNRFKYWILMMWGELLFSDTTLLTCKTQLVHSLECPARRCIVGDSRWRRIRRYTWDTSFAWSRSESLDTPDRTHGNTLSVPRPSCSLCTTDRSTAPVEKIKQVLLLKNCCLLILHGSRGRVGEIWFRSSKMMGL